MNSNRPLCSVITPTWLRHGYLLDRCAASVQAQDYENVEHVIVSDGPDPELADLILEFIRERGRGKRILYYELPEHAPEPNFGHYARNTAVELSTGDYLTYNDDDDCLRPEHCRLLATALDEYPHAGFAVSRMMSWNGQVPSVIGWGPLACGNVGTPMIMHRREILAHGTWGPPSRLEDWEVVEKWLNAGVPYVNVDAETADVWPSIFR